jgi:hypothetical protein
MKALQARLSYANVTATLALVIALGGASAFAATQLGKNTVGPKQLRKNAVVTAKIKNQAVTAAKIANGTLTGTQIDVSTLGTVPSAQSAATAKSAQTAAGLAPAEPWHEVGAPGEPKFRNGWKSGGSSSNPTIAFYKDQIGIVHLRGVASAGTPGQDVFSLPPGYRPAESEVLRIPIACDAPCAFPFDIAEIYGSGFIAETDGAVYVNGTTNNLEGVSFRAEG